MKKNQFLSISSHFCAYLPFTDGKQVAHDAPEAQRECEQNAQRRVHHHRLDDELEVDGDVVQRRDRARGAVCDQNYSNLKFRKFKNYKLDSNFFKYIK